MKLFAQIKDMTGADNGLDGLVVGFATLAETDDELAPLLDAGACAARTEEELEAAVGYDIWPFFVEVPRYPDGHEHAGQFLRCAGWRYEGGKFIPSKHEQEQ